MQAQRLAGVAQNYLLIIIHLGMAGLNAPQASPALRRPSDGRDGFRQAFDRLLALGKPMANSLLFFRAAAGAAENLGLRALENRYLLYFESGPHPNPVVFQQLRFKLLHLVRGVPPRTGHRACESSLDSPRSVSSHHQDPKRLAVLTPPCAKSFSMVDTSARLPSNVS